MPIRALPPLLVNQIAAGEVIERPASVVKEAVENSIDAGSSHIEVTIECGGCELIRIADNGHGIPFDELELALAAHATSKITDAEDLDAIATMGFRGEALASIASVSRLSLVSRTRDADGAARIEAEGDQIDGPRPVGAPPGTTLTVRNLFFNTPARRKFMRTERTEASRCREVVEGLALAHPSIGFVFRNDGRVIFDLAADQSPRDRVLEILGRDMAEELLELDDMDGGVRLWGLIGRPSIARQTSRHLHVFLNGRVINDRSINHAIREGYRGLIEPARYPTAALFMTIDPAEVDVNVHPAKAEVRFRNQGRVHRAVLMAFRRALAEADLTPEVDLGRAGGAPAPVPIGSGLATPGGSETASPTAFVEYFRRLDPKQRGFVYREVREAVADAAPESLADETTVEPAVNAPTPLPTVRSDVRVLQVHKSYLVTEDEHGIVIIDQHALHERIMFERLKSRITGGTLESQRLLMPAVVEAEPRQVELLDSLKPVLERIGIEADTIGPRTIAVHAFTSLLFERRVDPVTFMTELLDRAMADGRIDEPESALHEVLDMMACKAAVKAGDPLTEAEIADLIQSRDDVDRSSNCPHGRPTTLRLTIKDLERQFGRS